MGFARLGNVGPILLAGVQVFLKLKPSLERYAASAERPTLIFFLGRLSRSSAKVASGVSFTSARTVSACGARIAWRQPPIFFGSRLPVRASACISLIAVEAATEKRLAAPCRDMPQWTASEIRSRKSME